MFKRLKGQAPKAAADVEPPKPSIPTVKFDPRRVTEGVKADLRENIKALGEVGIANFELIYEAALRSITAGRDLHVLYVALMTIDGMTKSRASNISRSLNNKAASLMEVNQQVGLGIEYALWCHSGAPCGPNDDRAHRAANGKPYRVASGMLLNDRRTWPGREEGCKCESNSIIAGLNGYAGGTPEGIAE